MASRADYQPYLDASLEWVEWGLNIAGYVPIVSKYSGPVRMGIGTAQFVGATTLAAGLWARSRWEEGEESRKDCDRAYRVLTYSKHGLQNVVRGAIEWYEVGITTCLPYDLFEFRSRYPTEAGPHEA